MSFVDYPIGLFNKAIISGAAALTPRAFHDNQVEIGLMIGHSLRSEGTSRQELAEFLRQQPTIDLQRAAEEQHGILTAVVNTMFF